VNPHLSRFQKKLCNALQQGLPLCTRPFAEIAGELGTDEARVLQETRGLLEAGVIRRVCAVVNHRALGMSGTLVAAHVPPEKLEEVAGAVNRLPGVSHNYLRNHNYNLWFTLQERTSQRMRQTLRDLEQRSGVVFHSLPVTRVFKLDVRFDAEAEEDVLVQEAPRVPGTEPVALNADQESLLAQLPGNLEVESRPYEAFRAGRWSEDEVLRLLGELQDAGVIRRLRLLGELQDAGVIRRVAAVMNHRKLGYTANVMFAAEVPGAAIAAAGPRLARFRTVSHCYERETFAGWPYSLFAMMHGRSMGQIQRTIDKFIEPGDVRAHELLPTQTELKKQPVRHHLL
jgi:DNA-binding Lrp family transcriptional regulator